MELESTEQAIGLPITFIIGVLIIFIVESISRELQGKEMIPGNRKHEKAKHVMQHYLRERRRQRQW